ncbi:zinc finger protein DZIP1L-like [Ctenocephalides felis]|uniref:zinc finger protein DZIP1L-like n=1 Tax=Ctenocephalides felis TaxID=7515 RepID=UPI000E6E22A3|nr:zinc finger protein DZIP1L-like [Ctenocephalides felis]
MSCRVSYTWHHDFPKLAKEAGFCFNDPSLPGKFDWASIGSVDVDRIYRERDFASLEYSLQYILDGPIGSLLESRALDAAVSKLFRVSQLAIQYLLFCKQFLDRSVTVMRATIKEQQKEITNLKKNIKSKDDQIQKLRQKKIEKDFALESGRSLPIIHSHGLDPSCHVCGKTFLNIVYLQAHLQRRHKDEQPERDSGPVVHQNQLDIKSMQNITTNGQTNVASGEMPPLASSSAVVIPDSQLIDIVKLQLEIKQLKERLANAEKTLIASEEIDLCKRTSDRKFQDASVNTDQPVVDNNILGEDKYELEIKDLKEQFLRSIESLKDRTSWMEINRKIEDQENLWKNRCDALENKFDQDTKHLMQILSDIKQANLQSASSMKKAHKKKSKTASKSLRSRTTEDFSIDKENKSQVNPLQPSIKLLGSDNNEHKSSKRKLQSKIPERFTLASLNEMGFNKNHEKPDKISQISSKKDTRTPNIKEKENNNLNKIVVEADIHDRDENEGLVEEITNNQEQSLHDEFLKTKPSTSNIQYRSLSSLREALFENPEELKMYRDSLIGDLEQRLWKLNVDPSSNEMLDGDYQKCMNIIVHERKLKSKVSDYSVKSF